jgi:hypothetical protein
VAGFRLYLFDHVRRVGERVSQVIRLAAEHEPDAVEEAHRLREGRYGELWRHDHLVEIFDAD